jgi:hypothetical protein
METHHPSSLADGVVRADDVRRSQALPSRPVSRHWKVDRIHCHLLGQGLVGLGLKPKSHPLQLSRSWQIWVELLTVTICHQANWDKLHSIIVGLAGTDPSRIHPRCLSQISGAEFRQMFGAAYDADRIRTQERVRLLRGTANAMETDAEGPKIDWLPHGPIRLAGESGLYNHLGQIEAFRADPLQKKSRILVHDLLQYELISVSDPENIAPAVDYHLIRLYVRTGRVFPVRVELLDRLTDQGTPRVEFHTDLRAAVEEAMTYSAASAGIRIDQLNQIEWQIARSYCTRRNPRCNGPFLPEKPIDFELERLAKRVQGCPIRCDCRGATDPELRSIVDPRSASPYY